MVWRPGIAIVDQGRDAPDIESVLAGDKGVHQDVQGSGKLYLSLFGPRMSSAATPPSAPVSVAEGTFLLQQSRDLSREKRERRYGIRWMARATGDLPAMFD